MRHFLAPLLAFGGLSMAFPAGAQENDLEQICEQAAVQAFGARDECLATAQAVTSAQPVIGILLAGGNPTLGSSGAAGLRLGLIPKVSAGVRLNVVPVRLPAILQDQIAGEAGDLADRYGLPAPAISGDVSLGIFNGISVAPTIGGIGGISLLGSASYLPLSLLEDEGFEDSDLAYGYGARLHLLNESFLLPGISLSVMRRHLPTVEFGDVCPSGLTAVTVPGSSTGAGGCAGEGDAGEFSFNLSNWSTRLVASKRLLGLGATVGLGHDSYDSDIGFGFRGSSVVPGTSFTPAFRVADQDLESSRWSVFGNLSYTLLVASLSLEAGWQQGHAPISSFEDIGGDFDPRDGSWFGSVGARLAL